MISFPSSLNESQSQFRSTGSQQYHNIFDIQRLKALNLTSSVPVMHELLKPDNINISKFDGRPELTNYDNPNQKDNNYNKNIAYENPLTLPSELISTAKDYEWVYNIRAKSIYNIGLAEGDKGSITAQLMHTAVAPSMFNSFYGVNAVGLVSNVPLLNDSWNIPDTIKNMDNDLNEDDYKLMADNEIKELDAQIKEKEEELKKVEKAKYTTPNNAALTLLYFESSERKTELEKLRTQLDALKKDSTYTIQKEKIAKGLEYQQSADHLHPKFNAAANLSDCSIRELCTLSKYPNSILGQARYKYADFMYCKHLGKVPNNRLITLRRFAHPVGDHIFELTSPKHTGDNNIGFQQEGDIGRLISWFDTDDNKLEDIIKFSYHATWKPLTAQIEEQEGTADNQNSGVLGMIANTLNPAYNRSVGAGHAGTHSLLGYLGTQMGPPVTQGIGQNKKFLTNYDKNKVYEPKDRIQSTHIYDGALEFNNQFTLTFSYVLRGYENINPKSAFLDLIGNILEVTYRRGRFWGGARKTIGPNANLPMFNKVNRFIDDAWAKAGGFMEALASGGINFGELMGQLAKGVNSLIQGMSNAVKNIMHGGLAEYGKQLVSLAKDSAIGEGLKGYLKNAIGRPQLIAWQSLLDGSDVGLWHVTIGNPKNPIVAMGNLILDDATITQSGPLGLDDFPSELKVTVSLKHARPRDITDIGKMYTKGIASLYKSFGQHRLTDFYKMKQENETRLTAVYNKDEEVAQEEYKKTQELIKQQREQERQRQQETSGNTQDSTTEDNSGQNNDNSTNNETENKTTQTAEVPKAIPWETYTPSAAEGLNDAEMADARNYAPANTATNNSIFFKDEMMITSMAGDDPTIGNDPTQARIAQSNNYTFSMIKIIQDEIA